MQASTLKPLHIRQVVIDPPLILAPMAGVTHIALRQLIAGFGGCGLYVSEMLSSRRVLHEKPATSFFINFLPNERPFFYQLMGNDPESMAGAICHLENVWEETGQGPDGFDINMGCSAPVIRRQGCGSALMRDPAVARKVVAVCRKVTERPLTVKIRLGWKEDFEETVRFSLMLAEEGIDAVTLHPRLVREKLKRRARWQYVGMLKKELSIPVIGNGDIASFRDVYTRLEESECDGVMIGRAAAAMPWIFQKTIEPERSFTVHLDETYLLFVGLLKEHFPAERRLGRLKEFTHYFARNFRFGHYLASVVQTAETVDEAVSRAMDYFAKHSSEISIAV